MAPITIIPKACSCCKGERSSRDKSSNLPLPNILYEGSEGKVDGPSGRGLWPPDGGRLYRRVVKGKVLKMDRPAAGGFLSLTGPLAPRVVVAASPQFLKKGRGWRRGLCRRVVFASAQGATAAPPLRVADCRSAAMLIKSALREFLPALIVILSRRRRISVQGTYELIDSKYQSAGRAKYQAPA